jgi:hypothetical protein
MKGTVKALGTDHGGSRNRIVQSSICIGSANSGSRRRPRRMVISVPGEATDGSGQEAQAVTTSPPVYAGGFLLFSLQRRVPDNAGALVARARLTI